MANCNCGNTVFVDGFEDNMTDTVSVKVTIVSPSQIKYGLVIRIPYEALWHVAEGASYPVEIIRDSGVVARFDKPIPHNYQLAVKDVEDDV